MDSKKSLSTLESQSRVPSGAINVRVPPIKRDQGTYIGNRASKRQRVIDHQHAAKFQQRIGKKSKMESS